MTSHKPNGRLTLPSAKPAVTVIEYKDIQLFNLTKLDSDLLLHMYMRLCDNALKHVTSRILKLLGGINSYPRPQVSPAITHSFTISHLCSGLTHSGVETSGSGGSMNRGPRAMEHRVVE